MKINDQAKYWNSVDSVKTFTHPVNLTLLNNFIKKDSIVIDVGCGYGRIIELLKAEGFNNVIGFDTSVEMIKRGISNGIENIFHFNELTELPISNNSVDCFMLFAVLTCIPENSAQNKLMSYLKIKLKPKGIIYISDYYIQNNLTEFKSYDYLNDDRDNYGIFQIEEGAIFRHHTKERINYLLDDFELLHESQIDVKTMNGHEAEAFQLIIKKYDTRTPLQIDNRMER